MKLPNIFEKEVTPQSFSAGSVIFGEGEHGNSMYVVKSGEVDIYIHDHLVETVVPMVFSVKLHCLIMLHVAGRPSRRLIVR
jgi:hypothetical protein